MSDLDKERFEAHFAYEGVDLNPTAHTIKMIRWEAWQAATSAQSSRIARLEEALVGLMEVERRGRVMPIGREWDAARAALKKALGEE